MRSHGAYKSRLGWKYDDLTNFRNPPGSIAHSPQHFVRQRYI